MERDRWGDCVVVLPSPCCHSGDSDTSYWGHLSEQLDLRGMLTSCRSDLLWILHSARGFPVCDSGGGRGGGTCFSWGDTHRYFLNRASSYWVFKEADSHRPSLTLQWLVSQLAQSLSVIGKGKINNKRVPFLSDFSNPVYFQLCSYLHVNCHSSPPVLSLGERSSQGLYVRKTIFQGHWDTSEGFHWEFHRYGLMGWIVSLQIQVLKL